MNDAQLKLRESWLDLAYTIAKALGVIALSQRLGLTPKLWVRERMNRDD